MSSPIPTDTPQTVVADLVAQKDSPDKVWKAAAAVFITFALVIGYLLVESVGAGNARAALYLQTIFSITPQAVAAVALWFVKSPRG